MNSWIHITDKTAEEKISEVHSCEENILNKAQRDRKDGLHRKRLREKTEIQNICN